MNQSTDQQMKDRPSDGRANQPLWTDLQPADGAANTYTHIHMARDYYRLWTDERTDLVEGGEVPQFRAAAEVLADLLGARDRGGALCLYACLRLAPTKGLQVPSNLRLEPGGDG